MTPLPFFQVDAFAQGPFSGNPAAVMPLDHWLDDATMQAMASENNLSETAFTVPSERDDADYDLRWFTPTMEVPLCGHATLAAAHILLRGAEVRFVTQSGILIVTRDADDETLLKLDDGRVAHVWLQAAPGAPLQQAFDMASGLRFGADRQVAAGQ